MDILQQLNKDLLSSNLSYKIEAVEYIGEKKYYDFGTKLLKMLSNEKNINVLNALALSLGKLKINDAVPILMEYIKNPNFKDMRGSFVYALIGLDCKAYFLDFVNLICEGNFEVFSGSFSVFESIIDDVDFSMKIEAKNILEKQRDIELEKPEVKGSRFDRIRYVEEAIELLDL